jgi:hypothetical protein
VEGVRHFMMQSWHHLCLIQYYSGACCIGRCHVKRKPCVIQYNNTYAAKPCVIHLLPPSFTAHQI